MSATKFIANNKNEMTRTAAVEFRKELVHFNHDGLTQLSEDLGEQRVKRGSWSGCPASYRAGAPGSVRRDRLGRARNEFTVVWDNGWITNHLVRDLVDAEIKRRTEHLEPKEVEVPVPIHRDGHHVTVGPLRPLAKNFLPSGGKR